MNLVDLLTRQGLTARTLDNTKQLADFQRAFLSSPLPNRHHRSSHSLTMSEEDEIENDNDDDDRYISEPTTPPSSPTHATQQQTNALLHQVMQRLVCLSRRTLGTLTTPWTSSKPDSNDFDNAPISKPSSRRSIMVTPPSSPTFEGLIAPTPNTALHAMKTSTFLRVSSFNQFTNQSLRQALSARSPGEIPSAVDELLRGRLPRL
jgi:hypothetical protein